MFCSPYPQISICLTVIDSIAFVTIDATFGKFICFIFVGKNFVCVVGVDASGSDIAFFEDINYFVANVYVFYKLQYKLYELNNELGSVFNHLTSNVTV